MQSEASFSVVQIALSRLLEGTIETDDLSLKGRLSDLHELMEDPSSYVENPNNFAEFQALIKDRIRAKIDRIARLSIEGKRNYCAMQRAHDNELRDNRAKLSRALPPKPGDGRHVMSEEQAKIIELFEKESNGVPFSTFFDGLPVCLQHLIQEHPSFILLLMKRGVSLHSLKDDKTLLDLIYKHKTELTALLKAGLYITAITGCANPFREQLLKYSVGMARLARVGVFPLKIATLEEPFRTQIMQNASSIADLLEAGTLFDDLISYDAHERQWVIENINKIIPLVEGGMSIGILVKLDSAHRRLILENRELRERIVQNGANIAWLLRRKDITFEMLCELETPFKELVFTYAGEIDDLIQTRMYSFDWIRKLKEPFRRTFIQNGHSVANITRCNTPLEEICKIVPGLARLKKSFL